MRIDTRAGSIDYIVPLKAMGVPVEGCTLPAGDVEIMGNGPEGRVVPVGVELKKLPDILACMRDGRFAEQNRKMDDAFEVKWLLIEGRLRVKDNGKIQVAHKNRWRTDGQYGYQELTSYLQTMSIRGGALLWRTEEMYETLCWLRSLWLWWTKKDYESHRAHLDYHRPATLGGCTPFEPPSLVQRVAAVLPGVGSTRSVEIASTFSSVENMACATPEEFATIKGIGKKGAEKLVNALRGSE
jgi:hypothetical protein